jgi:hypothetical protein
LLFDAGEFWHSETATNWEFGMKRSFVVRAVSVFALSFAASQSAWCGVVAFTATQDQVLQWVQSPGAVTLVGNGYLGQRFVRLEDGGSIATYLTTSALANAMYGMTAAFAMFAPTSTWTMEVFAGGAPEATSTTPAGSTLLVSASGTLDTLSTDIDPVWTARGTGYSSVAQAPVAGTPIWLRVRAVGGALGVDSILGVENVDSSIWFPGDVPTRFAGTNWDFEVAEVPEPFTLWLVAPALLTFFTTRRRA